jgi:alpha-glucosidase
MYTIGLYCTVNAFFVKVISENNGMIPNRDFMKKGTAMHKFKWWQKAVFYQIYPRSFADGNGDGIGDFVGMISKLDYLKDLGIDAVWLSPHFPSPQHDCGYDISDYQGVEPDYGTMGNFKQFLDGAHQRGIRVILDLVLNHTSDQHPWFIESRSSLDNPKRDWYIWRDGRAETPPNNWNSTFGGSAWEYDPTTSQYYYHFFLKQQPDLNWRNPDVKKAMFKAVRFWLDMGVDGFRLDAIGTIFEHPEMPDHTVQKSMVDLGREAFFAESEEERLELFTEFEKMFELQVEQPGVHELMQELRSVSDEYDGDRLLVGENDLIDYYGNGENELHMVFNFPLMRTEQITPEWIRNNQDKRLAELAAISPNAWAANTLGNHDCQRVYGNYGDGTHHDEYARLSLALILTLRGTPFLYNGEEIGMTDLILDNIQQFRDVTGIWQYETMLKELKISPEQALPIAAKNSRDKNRTPMQWQNSPNGGFCPPTVHPWLPVNSNYASGINVAEQENQPESLLNFYRKMLLARKRIPALIAGDYQPLKEDAKDYLAFLRHTDDQTCLVVLNYSKLVHVIDFSDKGTQVEVLFSSLPGRAGNEALKTLTIQPFEIFIGQVAPNP